MFTKTKTKLSLIDDYIFIEQLKNLYGYYYTKTNNNLFYSINILLDGLICAYDQIFLRLKLYNTSLILLKQQILYSTGFVFAKNTEKDITNYSKVTENLQKVKNIKQNLGKKLKKLCFNPFEINFILSTCA